MGQKAESGIARATLAASALSDTKTGILRSVDSALNDTRKDSDLNDTGTRAPS
jgi:hypothetical protein